MGTCQLSGKKKDREKFKSKFQTFFNATYVNPQLYCGEYDWKYGGFDSKSKQYDIQTKTGQNCSRQKVKDT